MKISLDKTVLYDKKDFLARFYVEKRDKRAFNALLVECITHHYKTRLLNATRIYFVVEGSGSFTIDGKREDANMYDCFIIESGQTYTYEGKMRLIEVNVPATDSANEEVAI